MLARIQYGTSVFTRLAGRSAVAIHVQPTIPAATRLYRTKKVTEATVTDESATPKRRGRKKRIDVTDSTVEYEDLAANKPASKRRIKKSAETSEDASTVTSHEATQILSNAYVSGSPASTHSESRGTEAGETIENCESRAVANETEPTAIVKPNDKSPEDLLVDLSKDLVKSKKPRGMVGRRIILAEEEAEAKARKAAVEESAAADSTKGRPTGARRGRPPSKKTDAKEGAPKPPLKRPRKKKVESDATAENSKPRVPGPATADADLVQALVDLGIGKVGGRRKPEHFIDTRRVNVVSSKLCDDILQYVGPSLERHRGCDIIDLNPGVGIWSRKLHNFLQPRRHIMMEIDAEKYTPFISDLVSKPQVELIPKSGFVWKDLLETLRDRLPEQPVVDRNAEPKRNDTLLVIANLSMFPKKSFQAFGSVATMVSYQFLSSIRMSTLFQRYGLVRMLLWVDDDDKKRLLPRTISKRKRSAFEAGLSCDWIHEVAALDNKVEDRTALRDYWITKESGLNTLKRMADAGLTMPPGREPAAYLELKANSSLMGRKLAGVHEPTFARPFKAELMELEGAMGLGDASEETMIRIRSLRKRDASDNETGKAYLELIQQYEAVQQLAQTSPEDFGRADELWSERLDNVTKNTRKEFGSVLDAYRTFRQDPSALHFDRRAYEPLMVRAEELYPRAPTTLLDVQPKAMHPLLRQYGPGTSRAGDMSDVMLRSWFQQPLADAPRAMDGIWAGFGELAAQCPSLVDPRYGGSAMTGHGSMRARNVSERQWVEILEAWMDWPFQPSYVDMLTRLVEDDSVQEEEDETKSGAFSPMT